MRAHLAKNRYYVIASSASVFASAVVYGGYRSGPKSIKLALLCGRHVCQFTKWNYIVPMMKFLYVGKYSHKGYPSLTTEQPQFCS